MHVSGHTTKAALAGDGGFPLQPMDNGAEHCALLAYPRMVAATGRALDVRGVRGKCAEKTSRGQETWGRRTARDIHGAEIVTDDRVDQ